VDIFVSNAGIEGVIRPIDEYPLDIFQQVMAVNVTGVWLGLKYIIPVMRERGGSIVITSSTAGFRGTPGISPYTASKHAVIGIMRTAALECARWNIRVNTVNPAPIETRMMRSLEEMHSASASGKATVETIKNTFINRIPLARYGTPDEVAALMLFLASDESRFCTGGVYMVDGGMSAGTF
jgi:NAD(P)-dependent dehydrogenase (short-subunit alcohol dehydrogenase family)